MGPHRFGGTNHRSEIVRVRDPIQGQQKRGLTQFLAAVDQGIKIQGVCSGRLQGNPLMHRTTCDLTKAGPGDLLNKDSRAFGITEKLQELGCTAHFRRAPDAVNRTAGLQGRQAGVATPDQIVGRWCRCDRLRLEITLRAHPGKGTAFLHRARASILAGITSLTANTSPGSRSPVAARSRTRGSRA